MWTKYDETLSDFIAPGDIIKHHGRVITVDSIDDDSDPVRIKVYGINEMDDDVEAFVPCGTYVPLVYWQD